MTINIDPQKLCKIRTITTFISLDSDQSSWSQKIFEAATLCTKLSQALMQEQYDVQSVRIVTNPFGEYLNLSNLSTAREGLSYLAELLQQNNQSNLRLRFAIGEAKSADEIELLPQLISEFGDLCNVCVNIPVDDHAILDNQLITHCARAVRKISQMTPGGEGNFNFTVNFNCAPLIPYFPASYHDKKLGPCVVVGLETPDLLVHTLQNIQLSPALSHQQTRRAHYEAMHQALQYHIDKIDPIAKAICTSEYFKFCGFDSSAAPSKDCASMVDIYRLLGVPYFGASGTLEASALLTKVFKSIRNADLVGFSGLMLALTEDRGLAQASIDNQLDIGTLLSNSSVCGIGLDTVPIPGDTSIAKIAALMRDTGTLAFRLNKPLTVRLFPVPGLKAGELTTFTSDDLCNAKVLAVP